MSASREKKALVLFFALLAACFVALISYIIVGHMWNVTATNLDDIYGELDNYTVILCEAPLNSLEEQDAFDAARTDAQALPQKTKNLLNQGSSGAFINPFISFGSIEALLLYEGSLKSASSLEDPDDTSDLPEDEAALKAQTTSDRKQSLQANKEGALQQSNNSETKEASADEASKRNGQEDIKKESLDESTGANRPLKLEKRQLRLQEMMDDYRIKGAGVFLLNTIHPSIYRNGMIITSQARSFGVLYLDPNKTPYDAAQLIQRLRMRGAQTIVAITPTLLYAKQLKDLDIVISLRDEQLYFLGETHSETFYKDLPHDSSIVSVLISPSGVISGKELG